ncbi:MAG: phospholipid carrier-dependent glycosyltransferase, partial [Pyrinomonadaceae bacterium]
MEQLSNTLTAKARASIAEAGIKPKSNLPSPVSITRDRPRALKTSSVITLLSIITIIGFCVRVIRLDSEGLSEDELNKLVAVEDYRSHGLSAQNSEHPMLMKAAITVSLIAADKWNSIIAPEAQSPLHLSMETSLRLPNALFGALALVLLFFLVREMFGSEIGYETGLIAAALMAFDPSSIGFNRIAKEDTLFLFFLLLAGCFWLRGRRAAETSEPASERYYWATAVSMGAMMASKYMAHFLGLFPSFYHIFQEIPSTKWRLGHKRWLIFIAIMALAFLIFSPTILLPATWLKMRAFAGEGLINHDSYEFMGTLFPNKMSLWLKGVPWYFYYVFIGVKIPVLIVIAAIAGLAQLCRKNTGDGRFFLFFWALFWFLPFTVLGGKFTRYFTTGLPIILILASVGIHHIALKLSGFFENNFSLKSLKPGIYPLVISVFLLAPMVAIANSAPYYRLYTNIIGETVMPTGSYFPHDEFYDGRIREAAFEIAKLAEGNATVASETPMLFKYYAGLVGRNDLISISLSDKTACARLQSGDFVIIARGRRYFSNASVIQLLESSAAPVSTLYMGNAEAVRIYQLNDKSFKSSGFAARDMRKGYTFPHESSYSNRGCASDTQGV